MARTQTSQNKDSDAPDVAAVAEIPAVEKNDEPVVAEKTPEEKLPKRLVYIGPNVPGGALSQYQVFKGGYPLHCTDLFKKIPQVKELFVDVGELEKMKERAITPGTNEERLYRIVASALDEKGGV